MDITLDGSTLNTNGTILYSSNGDIVINCRNATINGIIYAPNGKVIVKNDNFNVNSAIIAKNIVIIQEMLILIIVVN